ncbi:MAG: DUF1501 domain-containing protein [bacterium]|nr:DUF1501 domain-containing protein [bacterium]
MHTADHNNSQADSVNRRTFLSNGGISLASVALSQLLCRDLYGREPNALGLPSGLANPGALPHFTAKVKRVIFLYMAGGPSHLETFDFKPELNRLDGQPMPASYTAGQPIAQLQGKELRVQGHLTKFSQHGENGLWISDFLPEHRKIIDKVCVLKSMVTEQINHDPAHTFMNTGTAISGRPSMGSWITYGLGSECDDLPGFVVMTSIGGRNPQPIATRQWSAGCLPSRFQGVEFNAAGEPVHYVKNPAGVSSLMRAQVVDTIRKLDQHRNQLVEDPEIATRVAAYEMAFKMQTSVPQLMDLSDEPDHVLKMYGATPGDGSFAANCLLARRLAERGVRFIQLYHRGWDHHGDLVKHMHTCCGLTDRPTAALLQDLEQRGMLHETLVIWGGEFGRTPMFQGKGGPGRDHHIKGFSMWLAGGGIQPGISYGATDELGYNAVENPIPIRNLHATILHLLGIDHHKLAIKFQGLNLRLTGVEHAEPIRPILS